MEVDATTTEQPLDRPTGKKMFSKESVLITVLVFNSLFVISQLVGTVLSNSITLFGDTLLMGIDTFCYALSFYAHRYNDEKMLKWVPICSTVLLLISCIVTIVEAFTRLDGGLDKGESVDVGIMAAFAVADLVIDCLFLGLFYKGRQFLFVSDDDSGDSDFNVMSVFAHAAADTLRTVTECVAVIIILAGQNAPIVDSVCAIIMSVIAFIASGKLLYSLLTTEKASRLINEDTLESI